MKKLALMVILMSTFQTAIACVAFAGSCIGAGFGADLIFVDHTEHDNYNRSQNLTIVQKDKIIVASLEDYRLDQLKFKKKFYDDLDDRRSLSTDEEFEQQSIDTEIQYLHSEKVKRQNEILNNTEVDVTVEDEVEVDE